MQVTVTGEEPAPAVRAVNSPFTTLLSFIISVYFRDMLSRVSSSAPPADGARSGPPRRRDLCAIRAQLMERVPAPEYWAAFADFVNGQCDKEVYDDVMEIYLADRESRRLHNELVRAIIFNAYFAADAPPGVALPPLPPERSVSSGGVGFGAARRTIRSRAARERVECDEGAVEAIWCGLQCFLEQVLDRTVRVSRIVSVNSIVYALESDNLLSGFASKQTCAKYGIAG